MRAIDRFILHVVHNWKNKLNEAYSEKAIQGFINKFKEEADDLNINITDDQLRSYINNFDRIKEKLPSDQRDLTKWNLSKLIRTVTTSKGDEAAEEIDITPDVVYHSDDNTIVIYNGSKEDNCIRYGNGEKWCITRSSFSGYRYSEGRGYPTFYLAKNNNLSDNDKLSFVAIQVRDPQKTSEDNRYVYTNRDNSPYESNPMSFNELMGEIPWLREVPNIKSILKYIPLSSGEKITQQYKNNPISYREWAKLPFSAKQQYLVVRKGRNLFSDIDNEIFVERYLSKYPELAKFIAETPGVIDSFELLMNLDKFPNQIRRSITANIQSPINTKQLSSELLPFDVKKLLVQLNKWSLPSDERLYVTKDGDTIVKLTLGDNINIDLYQAEDDYPNIKLNKRTSKYLLDYPELDKIPLRNLLKLAEDEIIDRNLITKVLDDAKEDPNSSIIVKPVEDGEIILDSNSFSSYKRDDSGKISAIPFNNEEVQQVFNDSKDNEVFQQNALNLFKTRDDIPSQIDKKALAGIINSIPYNKRTFQDDSDRQVVLLTSDSPRLSFFTMNTAPNRPAEYLNIASKYDERGNINRYGALDNESITPYLSYLRQINKSFDDNELLNILRSSSINSETKKVFVRNNPPVNNNNRYRVVMRGNDLLVINTQNPRESLMLSDRRNNLKQANISPALAAQLLGDQAAAVTAPAAGRRGRPAGVPNAPRPAAAAPAAAGNINVSEEMDQIGLDVAFARLPRPIVRKLNVTNASRVDPNNDRGASRRNNILGNAGRVGRVIQVGASKIYIIRLANQQVIASINVQPGNSNYILLPNANGNVAIPLNSPSELLQALQQRNLAEIHQYLVNEYMERNPEHLTEFRQMLRQHINEKKKQNEQK